MVDLLFPQNSGCGTITRSDFFLRYSRNRVDLLPYKSKPVDEQEQYNWMAEKKLDGNKEKKWNVFAKYEK